MHVAKLAFYSYPTMLKMFRVEKELKINTVVTMLT